MKGISDKFGIAGAIIRPRALALPRHSLNSRCYSNAEAPFGFPLASNVRSKPPLGQMTVTLVFTRLSSGLRTDSAVVLWRPLPKQLQFPDLSIFQSCLLRAGNHNGQNRRFHGPSSLWCRSPDSCLRVAPGSGEVTRAWAGTFEPASPWA